MKLHKEIVIDRPRPAVWRGFDNPENLTQWQPTLKHFKLKSGVAGQVGAVSELTYAEKGGDIVLKEIVTERDEPRRFSGVYSNRRVTNSITNRFEDLGGEQTKWTVDSEFTFHTMLYRILSAFMRGAIVKRTDKDMRAFKEFIEESG